MTGEDLGYKPNVVEHFKSEYSSLGKVFNKGLNKVGKKRWTFKANEKY